MSGSRPGSHGMAARPSMACPVLLLPLGRATVTLHTTPVSGLLLPTIAPTLRMEHGLSLKTLVAEAESTLHAAGEAEHAERLAVRGAGLASPELRVVVFGEFSRGKSTLINALLGRRVLQAKAIPTTGHVTRIVYGEHDEVRALMRGGEVRTCGLDDLGSFTTLDLDRKAREDVEAIEVAVTCPLLRDGLVLIDTPGVCDPGAQTERALAAIASADLVLLVLNASQLLTEKEHELAVDWMARGMDKPVVPVVNWMNVVEERDQPELRERLDVWCHEHLSAPLNRPWFEVNALAALRHVLQSGPAPTDNFPALRAGLDGLTGPTRQKIQQWSRLGQLRADVAEARRENGNTLKTIRSDAEQVQRERDSAHRELQGRVEHLNAQAHLTRQAMMTHAAHTLDTRLDQLIGSRFKNKDAEQLRLHAHAWFASNLMEAASIIEKRAERDLLELTGEGLRRTEPLTIKERLVLKARLQVGKVKSMDASDETVGTGAIIGGVVGTVIFFAPGLGTAIGAGIGAYLAKMFGGKQPDYVAAYAEEARQQWDAHAKNVKQLLGQQFDARVDGLRRQLAGQLEQAQVAATDPAGLASELCRREEAEQALSGLEQALGCCAAETSSLPSAGAPATRLEALPS
jgi:tRNA U34 5-carboxymethylaminomethyl modifying GTPase MnmE/TrmE